jgi:hypothetical protein
MALSKDFSKLLGRGENPNGMVSQTANGTVRQVDFSGDGGDDGDMWRFGQVDGSRWNSDPRIKARPVGDEELTTVLRGRLIGA